MPSPTPFSFALLIIAALALAACNNDPDNQAGESSLPVEQQQVRVSGQGEVRATPSIFHIRGASTRQGDNIPAMQQAVDSEIRAALELADALGIPQEAVEASRIDVQPQWQWRPKQKLVGHQVSREIRFRVEGIEQYAELLSELTQLGFSQLHQAGREPADPQGLQDQALGRAMADATRKAQVLAKAAGRSLGEVLLIEEESAQRYHPQMMVRSASAGAESAAYRPGEITLEARVQVAFLLR